MRLWISRALCAMLLGAALPAALYAQQPAPMPVAGTPVPAIVIMGNPYVAATPYSPIVVGQAVPSPQLNRADLTLPCAIPNQNLDPYGPSRAGGCLRQLFGGNSCDGCGNAGGLGWLKSKGGCCTKGGHCTTCCNTNNFILGSSRSFFGESSREFFERPPSVDGVKLCPKKWEPGTQPAGGIIQK